VGGRDDWVMFSEVFAFIRGYLIAAVGIMTDINICAIVD
jgi:hypothetical protein